jgi:2'-5' RNA ligase
VSREVHLTTFYNAKVRLSFSAPLPHCLATIASISEWTTRRGLCVVALLICEDQWSHTLNAELVRTHGSTERTYMPHLTLERNARPGRAKAYQHLIGMVVEFDRHGIAQYL